jgi:hypothetical protein
MNKEINYDPIKLVNKNIYLNSIMVKQRYDMMSVNDYSIKRGIGYPDNNMFKIMSLVKSHDEGFINTHHGLNNLGFEDLTSRSLIYKDKIDKMMEKLDKINHTKLHNNIISKENNLTERTHNKIRITKKLKENKIDEDILFPRINYKSPIKRKVIPQVKEEKIKKRPIRKETNFLNRSNRILSILKKTEADNKPYGNVNYTDYSTMLTTEINQNNEKDEYYHMIVDDEVQLYKKYLIAPGQSTKNINEPTRRVTLHDSSKLLSLQCLLDQKELDQLNNENSPKKSTTKVKFSSSLIRKDTANKLKTSRNIRNTKFNMNPQVIKIEDRTLDKSPSIKRQLENRRRIIDNKLKPLKFYISENLKKLNKINVEYKNSFNQFNEFFESINYDNNMDKNILYEEVNNK